MSKKKSFTCQYLFILLNALLIFLISQVKTNSEKSNQKCYVLALEGGGDKGAYQVGVLKGLVDYIPENMTRWNVVTGISVGSINAAGISIFDIGKEQEAIDYLVNLWRNIKGKSDIYQDWPYGPLFGLFYKTSLFDTSPAKQLLEKIIQTSQLKRKFVIGATNANTGEFTTWDENSLYKNENVKVVLSSSAYPVIFPLIEFRNETYMDGCVRVNLNIPSGINKCLDAGFKQEDIVVDAVLCNSNVMPEGNLNKIHPLGVLIRVFEIYAYDNSMRLIDEARRALPKVNTGI
jgi:predicted acylesterase/phospholipase RssA